jgi:hypothetical protein
MHTLHLDVKKHLHGLRQVHKHFAVFYHYVCHHYGTEVLICIYTALQLIQFLEYYQLCKEKLSLLSRNDLFIRTFDYKKLKWWFILVRMNEA